MTIKESEHEMKLNKSKYQSAKQHIELTTGEMLKMARELNELTQVQLSNKTGIPQSDISAFENGRINLGAERAKVFAVALNIHPAMLLFPNWPLEQAKLSEKVA